MRPRRTRRANGNGTGAGPHQARTVGGAAYQYDANGNLLSGGGRTLTWDSENRVASVTANGVTESSTYDADGERATKTSGALTTVYLDGMWEEVVGGAVQLHYAVGGMLAAVRDSGSGAVTYLHSDHLGSVSLATTNSGSGPVVASEQLFTPWGTVRTGGIGQTTTNYTGQRLDGSGLLYYHARYYDPALARFISADSVVPGSASGSMDGVALKPLTVDFHEPGFAATLTGENAQPFRFQMNADQRQQAGDAGGPLNPQALNRYSYVLNNPVNGTDPSGHCGGDGIGSNICGGGGSAGGSAGGGGGGGRWFNRFWERLTGRGGDQRAANVSQPTTISRPLTAKDLGIKGSLQELRGTFSVNKGVATVRIDMIRGEIKNPLQVLQSLSATARTAGAKTLRIEGLLANEQLNNILVRRYGMRTEGGVDFIEIPLQ